MGVVNHCPYIDSGKVGTYAGDTIATARNKQELNRKPLTSLGTYTFDRVHWLVALEKPNKLHTHHVRRSCEY